MILGKVKIVDLLFVFWKCLTFFITILPNLISRILSKQQVVESLVMAYVQSFGRFGNFFSFLENYRAKSQIKSSSKKPGFGNLLSLSGHDLFFAEKKLRISESQCFMF